MKQFDILLNIGGELEWVCECFSESLERAISDCKDLVGGGDYVGHKAFEVVGGKWVEVAA